MYLSKEGISMHIEIVRRDSNIYDVKHSGPKLREIEYSKRYGPFRYILRNSVLGGSRNTWYPGLMRDSLQIMNYREVN